MIAGTRNDRRRLFLLQSLKDECDDPKVTLVGFQPAHYKRSSKEFHLPGLDLDEDNTGQNR